MSAANKKVFLFFCIGSGETAQAVGLAKSARAKGIDCRFLITDLAAARFARQQSFRKITVITKKPSRVTPRQRNEGYDAEEVAQIIEKACPDVLILCNSKAYSWGFITRPPKPKPLIVSLDSNWLFGQYQDVKMPSWIDVFLVIFPKKAFRAGLKKYGGHYNIAPRFLKKITPVGFIPSWEKVTKPTKAAIRKKFNIARDEKLIFGYAGTGGTQRKEVLAKIFSALHVLNKKGLRYKLVYTGLKMPKRPWAIYAKQFLLKPENFNFVLGSADLAIFHQGLASLSQAIHSQVPVISNIPPKGNYHSGAYHTSFYEIKTLERLGVCKTLFRNLPAKHLLQEIQRLLENGYSRKTMQEQQKNLFEAGEQKALHIIIALLHEKQKQREPRRQKPGPRREIEYLKRQG